MHPEDAAKTISEIDYGLHCLLIYTDLSILREFYSNYIPEQIEDKEQVVQIMPFYETENSVRETISKGYRRGINMDKVENEEKSLIIEDSFGKYSIQKNAEFIWNVNQEMVKYANGLGKKGISIIGDMGSFLFEKRMQDLIDYELCLPKRFKVNLKGICLYHQKDFDRLPEDMKQIIINHHETAIRI
jgi:MEDS: MEthanogen/methylotroph, DcmR Sensory domain